MNHSNIEKTAPSAANTRDGSKTEINSNDFASNYTGHEMDMSMGNKPNLARVAGLSVEKQATLDRLLMKFRAMSGGEIAYTFQVAAALNSKQEVTQL